MTHHQRIFGCLMIAVLMIAVLMPAPGAAADGHLVFLKNGRSLEASAFDLQDQTIELKLKQGGTLFLFLDSIDGIVKMATPAPPASVSDSALSRDLKRRGPEFAKLDTMIATVATEHRIDPDLVRAIVKVESNFNPRAVSPKGAKGLMQLLPATGRHFGVVDLFNPEQNLAGGIKYFKHLLVTYENKIEIALAAYNAGETQVNRHGGIPPFKETKRFVKKVLSLYSRN